MTLQTILHDLSQLLPDTFHRSSGGYFLPKIPTHDLRLYWISDALDWLDLAMVQAVCQEIIEARGWILVQSYNDTSNHDATIFRRRDLPSHHAKADLAALAIITALRDAIRAEQTK